MSQRRVRTWVVACVIGLTGFLPAAAGRTGAQKVARSVWDGVYTTAQAERGAVTYRQACRKCHYADLSGADAFGATPGEVPPGLVDEEFFFQWEGQSVAELFLAVARAMPQDRPGTLKPQATADVISYILQQNDFPAGDVELPVEPAELEPILIEESRE